MAEYVYLDDDIIRVYKPGAGKSASNLIATLFWGDRVKYLGRSGKLYRVEIPRREWDDTRGRYVNRIHEGVIDSKAGFRDTPVLKTRFVDVGQGDGAIIETPKGRVLLIDGGEEEHMRRYINVAFSHFLRNGPLHCEAIVVTHGDADHYSGLTELMNAWRSAGSPMISASRVFHNGLAKRSNSKQTEAFGKSRIHQGHVYATELVDDLRTVPDSKLNRPFREFKAALNRLRDKQGKPAIRRLAYADDDQFGFLHDEDIAIEVLGPITEDINGSPALPFLKQPGSSSLSASHTINGHSIVLRLVYGNVRLLFGADLNEESQARLLERARRDSRALTAEVLKVPHHGSADFNPGMLAAVRPVVSVVSSGDESVAREYIHPRAGLIGALGLYSRPGIDKPLIYVTEMVAFFEKLGKADVYRYDKKTGKPKTGKETYVNTYNKKVFGIVHIRTDGRRVLVATHSGKDDQKESYAFNVADNGDIRFEEKTRII
jgi:beta-lactamase superfamily II metal-dependent hydrolase